MKTFRLLTILVLIFLLCAPSLAEEVKPAEDEKLPNIFIWAIPEDDDGAVTEDKPAKKSKKQEENTEDEIDLMPEEDPIVLKTTTLKGYAEYAEGVDDILYMDDHKKFVLNINTPQQMAAQKPSEITNKIVPDMKNIYSISKFKGEEYSVSPANKDFVIQGGNWSLGTSYDAETTNITQLENTTSLFAKYENKYFSLSSKYKKNNMTVTQIQTDNFSVIPELKFNNIFAIQEVFSADMTRNRRSTELVFSIKPFGKQDSDRLRFDVGAKHTYDVNSGNSWSQLQFTTNFQL